MKHNLSIESQKLVLFKSFKDLRQVEKALKFLKEENTSRLELSVLGKFPKNEYNDINELEQEALRMQIKGKELFDSTIDFGYFENLEIGIIYIMGSLVSIFLYEINKKPLAVLSTGPYGILRGLGAKEEQTSIYLKLLRNGNCLLILRGYDYDLYGVQDELEKFA